MEFDNTYLKVCILILFLQINATWGLKKLFPVKLYTIERWGKNRRLKRRNAEKNTDLLGSAFEPNDILLKC